MTTIAYRDGIIAGDTQAQQHGLTRYFKKVHRMDDAIIGIAGNCGDVTQFLDWWRDGHNMDRLPDFRIYRGDGDAPDIQALVLQQDGLYLWTEHFQYSPVVQSFFAIGTGTQAALTAMHMGAPAVDAIRMAAQVDLFTGGEVEWEALESTTNE